MPLQVVGVQFNQTWHDKVALAIDTAWGGRNTFGDVLDC